MYDARPLTKEEIDVKRRLANSQHRVIRHLGWDTIQRANDQRWLATLDSRDAEIERLTAENASLKAGFSADGFTAEESCCGDVKQYLVEQIDAAWKALGYTVPPSEGTNVPLPEHSLAEEIVRRNQGDEAWREKVQRRFHSELEKRLADARIKAFRECAEIICPYCAVHDRAQYSFQDKGDGLEHLSTAGNAHLCKSVKLRRACPEAFGEGKSAVWPPGSKEYGDAELYRMMLDAGVAEDVDWVAGDQNTRLTLLRLIETEIARLKGKVL